jgi:hypothetical protein
MNKTSTVGQRIAGSIVGFLAGGVAMGALFVLVIHRDDDEWGMVMWYYGVALGILIGGAIGAALGASTAQTAMGQRSSFWRALLGAVAGVSIGLVCLRIGPGILFMPVPVVAGAVIGSGWKAKPAAEAQGQKSDQGGPTETV